MNADRFNTHPAMPHELRVVRHEMMMRGAGAPMTAENLTALGDAGAKTARRYRGKPAPKHRAWRLAALQSARAFYTLARRARS